MRHVRTIWISDTHLGFRESKAELLLDFLQHHEANQLYLVGDIVDGWALRRSWYWPAEHQAVLHALIRKARRGTRTTYIPGNHDAGARRFPGLRFGGITVRRQALHATADGRRLLVVHGDEFDGPVQRAPWLSALGASAYATLLRVNRWYNRVRQWMGKPYWSLAAYLKHKTKQAVQFMADFERVLAQAAREQAADGVVCGHIHRAALRPIGDVLYANTGDWVESCTALVEHFDGRLEIVRWTGAAAERSLPPGRTSVPDPDSAQDLDSAPVVSGDGHVGDGAARPVPTPSLAREAA